MDPVNYNFRNYKSGIKMSDKGKQQPPRPSGRPGQRQGSVSSVQPMRPFNSSKNLSSSSSSSSSSSFRKTENQQRKESETLENITTNPPRLLTQGFQNEEEEDNEFFPPDPFIDFQALQEQTLTDLQKKALENFLEASEISHSQREKPKKDESIMRSYRHGVNKVSSLQNFDNISPVQQEAVSKQKILKPILIPIPIEPGVYLQHLQTFFMQLFHNSQEKFRPGAKTTMELRLPGQHSSVILWAPLFKKLSGFLQVHILCLTIQELLLKVEKYLGSYEKGGSVISLALLYNIDPQAKVSETLQHLQENELNAGICFGVHLGGEGERTKNLRQPEGFHDLNIPANTNIGGKDLGRFFQSNFGSACLGKFFFRNLVRVLKEYHEDQVQNYFEISEEITFDQVSGLEIICKHTFAFLLASYSSKIFDPKNTPSNPAIETFFQIKLPARTQEILNKEKIPEEASKDDNENNDDLDKIRFAEMTQEETILEFPSSWGPQFLQNIFYIPLMRSFFYVPLQYQQLLVHLKKMTVKRKKRENDNNNNDNNNNDRWYLSVPRTIIHDHTRPCDTLQLGLEISFRDLQKTTRHGDNKKTKTNGQSEMKEINAERNPAKFVSIFTLEEYVHLTDELNLLLSQKDMELDLLVQYFKEYRCQLLNLGCIINVFTQTLGKNNPESRRQAEESFKQLVEFSNSTKIMGINISNPLYGHNKIMMPNSRAVNQKEKMPSGFMPVPLPDQLTSATCDLASVRISDLTTKKNNLLKQDTMEGICQQQQKARGYAFDLDILFSRRASENQQKSLESVLEKDFQPNNVFQFQEIISNFIRNLTINIPQETETSIVDQLTKKKKPGTTDDPPNRNNKKTSIIKNQQSPPTLLSRLRQQQGEDSEEERNLTSQQIQNQQESSEILPSKYSPKKRTSRTLTQDDSSQSSFGESNQSEIKRARLSSGPSGSIREINSFSSSSNRPPKESDDNQEMSEVKSKSEIPFPSGQQASVSLFQDYLSSCLYKRLIRYPNFQNLENSIYTSVEKYIALPSEEDSRSLISFNVPEPYQKRVTDAQSVIVTNHMICRFDINSLEKFSMECIKDYPNSLKIGEQQAIFVQKASQIFASFYRECVRIIFYFFVRLCFGTCFL